MFPEQFEHKNVAKSMENERFGRKNVANTADMAASSSKMLQIARKMDRTGNQKKKRKTEEQSLSNSGPNLKPVSSFFRACGFGSWLPLRWLLRQQCHDLLKIIFNCQLKLVRTELAQAITPRSLLRKVRVGQLG